MSVTPSSTPRAAHWLRDQLLLLDNLIAASESDVHGDSYDDWELSKAFLTQLLHTAQNIEAHEQVRACVVGDAGVSVTSFGPPDLAEPTAALSYDCLATGEAAASGLELGKLRQILVSGTEGKLAVFRLGQMDFSILAPLDTRLASVLSRRPNS